MYRYLVCVNNRYLVPHKSEYSASYVEDYFMKNFAGTKTAKAYGSSDVFNDDFGVAIDTCEFMPFKNFEQASKKLKDALHNSEESKKEKERLSYMVSTLKKAIGEMNARIDDAEKRYAIHKAICDKQMNEVKDNPLYVEETDSNTTDSSSAKPNYQLPRLSSIPAKPLKANRGQNLCKRIIQKDMKGNPICVWPSMCEAYSTLNISKEKLSKAVHAGNEYAGYIWQLESKYEVI